MLLREDPAQQYKCFVTGLPADGCPVSGKQIFPDNGPLRGCYGDKHAPHSLAVVRLRSRGPGGGHPQIRLQHPPDTLRHLAGNPGVDRAGSSQQFAVDAKDFFLHIVGIGHHSPGQHRGDPRDAAQLRGDHACRKRFRSGNGQAGVGGGPNGCSCGRARVRVHRLPGFCSALRRSCTALMT